LRPYRELINEFFRTVRHFQQAASAPKQKSEKLVCCETCGTWVPAGRAIGSGDAFFCSQECRTKPQTKNPRQRKSGRGSGSVWRSGTGVPPVKSRARCACHIQN